MEASCGEGRSARGVSELPLETQYSLPALLAGWTYYTVRLHSKRAVSELMGKVDSSPMPIWEFLLRRKIHRIRQHLREYGKPIKYDRRGLSKRNA